MSNRYIASLLRNNYRYRICCLSNSQRRTVPQPQRPRHVTVVAHRQNTARRHKTPVSNYQSTVVKRRIFEKNILDKARIDIGIYHIARFGIIIQRHCPFHNYQSPGLAL